MKKHDWNDDGGCTKCGFDGAAFIWWLDRKKIELSAYEYSYLRKHDPRYQMPECIHEDHR